MSINNLDWKTKAFIAVLMSMIVFIFLTTLRQQRQQGPAQTTEQCFTAADSTFYCLGPDGLYHAR